MKKAKNAFAIVAFVLGAVAVILAAGLPLIDFILAGKPYADAFGAIGAHFQNMLTGAKDLFGFGWFGDLGNHLAELVALILGGVGLVLFIVLLVLMCCKKHVKGLGWWIPMLLVFALSVLLVGVYRFDFAKYELSSYQELSYLGYAATIVAIAAAACFILSSIFYIVYVCKASKKAKVSDARKAALAKIESLLGGNK